MKRKEIYTELQKFVLSIVAFYLYYTMPIIQATKTYIQNYSDQLKSKKYTQC